VPQPCQMQGSATVNNGNEWLHACPLSRLMKPQVTAKMPQPLS
jgi:hypothetical protein